MHDQLPLIEELQQLDNRLYRLQSKVEALPQQLQAYDIACVEARQILLDGEGEIEQAERQRRALERELDGSQAQLTKTQTKLREVKTNKEYSAVLAEIDTGEQRIAVTEDQILELMETVELCRQKHQQQKHHEHVSEQELAQQTKRIRQEEATLAKQVAAEEATRQQLVADLLADLYTRYQQLSAIRDRQAVVLIQEGTCGGCHLKVPPQLISELRQQDKLITCPHCQRILLWPA
ncbi:MAG: C4-type zinc ribbon domain-containing protein [bacterium]|nr:C4-type zinc ribbon domain-containing protein [bacterium]